MAEVTWYGHACVGLRQGDTRVVLDPFSPQTGLRPLHVPADIVCVSHPNPKWHSQLEAVSQVRLTLDGLRLDHHPVTALGMRFNALVVGEDQDRGGEPNAMVMVYAGGVRYVHFGDLGHAVGPREEAFLGDADVWFVLAGGAPTITPEQVREAWDRLQPKVIIPIHFRTPALAHFAPLSQFLAAFPAAAVRRHGVSTVALSHQDLPPSPEIWVLEPACDTGSEA